MPLSKCCSAPMKVVGDTTKYHLCECCKKATDEEDKGWWREDFDKQYCPAFSDMIPVIERIVRESQRRERTNDMPKKTAREKLEYGLAEFLDDKIIHYANKFQGKVPPPPQFDTAPDWYKKTMLAVAHDISEHYL